MTPSLLLELASRLAWITDRLRVLPEDRTPAHAAAEACVMAGDVAQDLAMRLREGRDPYDAMLDAASGSVTTRAHHGEVLRMLANRIDAGRRSHGRTLLSCPAQPMRCLPVEQLTRMCGLLGALAERLRELPENRDDALCAAAACTMARLVTFEFVVGLRMGLHPSHALAEAAAGSVSVPTERARVFRLLADKISAQLL